MADVSVLEDSYRTELVAKISELIGSKESGSFLLIGNAQWEFGKLISEKIGTNMYMYADINEENLKQAEQGDCELFTTQCDITKPDEVAALGKYDTIVIKGIFEHGVTIELMELLPSIRRILKLNGDVVFIIRPNPTFPIPQEMQNIWEKSIPSMETFESAAQECSFDMKASRFSRSIQLSKESLQNILNSFASAVDLDISSLMDNIQEEPMTINDILHIIQLIKVID